MHLVYVYIENFENRIKQKEYNFSSRYNIHFDKNNNRLDVLENENYIKGFWPDNIYDIKAIVGENGCGKSTILDIIFSNFFEYRDFPYWDLPIFVFEGNEGLVVHKRSGYKLNLNPSIKESPIDFLDTHFNYRENINKTTNIVYYSNLWNQDNFSSIGNDLFNISTSAVIGSSRIELFNGNISNISEIYSYKTLEIQRQINFVLNKKYIVSKYIHKLPEYISVKLIDGLKQNSNKLTTQNEDFNGIINEYMQSLTSLKKEANLLNTIRVGFFTALAFAYIKNTTQYEYSETLPIWEKLTKLLSQKTTIETIIKDIRIIDKESVQQGYTITKSIELYAEFEIELKQIDAEKEINSYSIKIDDKIRNIYVKYIKSIPLIPYLEFNWREMSTGEKGLLALLSRFEYLKTLPDFQTANQNDQEQGTKDMIIVMDEVELYFHPNWQRRLIKILIEDIAQIFNGARIQFIISSHSPFLISDLPRENVIFLKKEMTELGTVAEPDGMNNTFAANIHELLANSFFMTNTIGDFAIEKISDIIKFIKGEDQSSVTDQHIAQAIINIIGEPVVRKRLQDLLNQKKSKHELISFYKEEIKKLEDSNNA